MAEKDLNDGAGARLEDLEHVSIPALDISLPPLANNTITAKVALLYPYSSSTDTAGILAAELDFRLRRKGGQVHIRFEGSAAKAIGKSGTGIGDTIRLSLEGATWTEDQNASKTPGRSIGAALLFRRQLRLEHSRDGTTFTSLNIDEPETSDQAEPTTPPASPKVTYTHATPVPSVLRSSQWSSPAFLRHKAGVEQPLLGPALYPFAADEEELDDRPRKRARFGRLTGEWQYIQQPPSPGDKEPTSWLAQPASPEKNTEIPEVSTSSAAAVQQVRHVDLVMEEVGHQEAMAPQDTTRDPTPSQDIAHPLTLLEPQLAQDDISQLALKDSLGSDTVPAMDKDLAAAQVIPYSTGKAVLSPETSSSHDALSQTGPPDESGASELPDVSETPTQELQAPRTPVFPAGAPPLLGRINTASGSIDAQQPLTPCSPTLEPVDSALLSIVSPFPATERPSNIHSWPTLQAHDLLTSIHDSLTNMASSEVATVAEPPQEAASAQDHDWFLGLDGTSESRLRTHDQLADPISFERVAQLAAELTTNKPSEEAAAGGRVPSHLPQFLVANRRETVASHASSTPIVAGNGVHTPEPPAEAETAGSGRVAAEAESGVLLPADGNNASEPSLPSPDSNGPFQNGVKSGNGGVDVSGVDAGQRHDVPSSNIGVMNDPPQAATESMTLQQFASNDQAMIEIDNSVSPATEPDIEQVTLLPDNPTALLFEDGPNFEASKETPTSAEGASNNSMAAALQAPEKPRDIRTDTADGIVTGTLGDTATDVFATPADLPKVIETATNPSANEKPNMHSSLPESSWKPESAQSIDMSAIVDRVFADAEPKETDHVDEANSEVDSPMIDVAHEHEGDKMASSLIAEENDSVRELAAQRHTGVKMPLANATSTSSADIAISQGLSELLKADSSVLPRAVDVAIVNSSGSLPPAESATSIGLDKTSGSQKFSEEMSSDTACLMVETLNVAAQQQPLAEEATKSESPVFSSSFQIIPDEMEDVEPIPPSQLSFYPSQFQQEAGSAEEVAGVTAMDDTEQSDINESEVSPASPAQVSTPVGEIVDLASSSPESLSEVQLRTESRQTPQALFEQSGINPDHLSESHHSNSPIFEFPTSPVMVASSSPEQQPAAVASPETVSEVQSPAPTGQEDAEMPDAFHAESNAPGKNLGEVIPSNVGISPLNTTATLESEKIAQILEVTPTSTEAQLRQDMTTSNPDLTNGEPHAIYEGPHGRAPTADTTVSGISTRRRSLRSNKVEQQHEMPSEPVSGDKTRTQAAAIQEEVAEFASHQLAQQLPISSDGNTPRRMSARLRKSDVPEVLTGWFESRRKSTRHPIPEVVEEEAAEEPESQAETIEAVLNSTRTTRNARKISNAEAETIKAEGPVLGRTPLDEDIAPASTTDGFQTLLSFYHPLSLLSNYLNGIPGTGEATLDVLAVATWQSKKPLRAKAGAKDFYTIMHIKEPSKPEGETEVHVYRPSKDVLPVADKGDVVLLRNFLVKSKKRECYLMSGESSAWHVWHFSQAQKDSGQDGKPVWAMKNGESTSDELEETRGAPVELGDEEQDQARSLRKWWEEVQAQK